MVAEAPTSRKEKMNKLFDSCSGCPSCFSADLLISPQVLQFWEEKVQHACHGLQSLPLQLTQQQVPG